MNRTLRSLFIVWIVVLFQSVSVSGQERADVTTHRIIITPQFFQIKDAVNYGLTYSGFFLSVGYEMSKETEGWLFTFAPDVGFGAGFNKGAGLAWRFKPVDLGYGIKTGIEHFVLGGYLSADYQWQQYSELQGGRLFWFSAIQLGPRILWRIPIQSRQLEVGFSNSLLALTSRPVPSTETTYYAFDFGEFISSSHRNLGFNTVNNFNHTAVTLRFQGGAERRLSWFYSFEYIGYYDAPTLSYINHAVRVHWKISSS